MRYSALIGCAALAAVAQAHVIPSGDGSPGLNLQAPMVVASPAARVCVSLPTLVAAIHHQENAVGCYYLDGGVSVRATGRSEPVALASVAKLALALGKPVPQPDVTTTAVEVRIASGGAAGRTAWGWASGFTNSAP